MRNASSQRRKRGFTLKELLCVVALFSFFAAILWPSGLGRGNENRSKALCRNNLKKIVLGFMHYIGDYDERCPMVFVTDSAPHGWADALQPYIRDTKVLQCPSDASNASSSPTENGYTDYWYNANLVRRIERGDKSIFKGIDAHHICHGIASQIVLFGEGGNSEGGSGHNATYNQCGDGSSLTGRNQICGLSKSLMATYPAAQIHLGGANFAFADGHVKWIKGDNASQNAQILSNRATFRNMKNKFAFWQQHPRESP